MPSNYPLLKGEITFDDVHFAYSEDAPILRGFDLHVAAGERVAIVGPSGSGKSTATMLVSRFYDPDRGAVLVDGHDVRGVTLQSLRRQIGVVFEEAFLFSDTVRANIAYGRPGATDTEIEAAARVSQAHEFILELPRGYDTIVGERGLTLSGGQRQRIALARAIVSDPRILILDDATSAIDSKIEEAIHEGLRGVMADRTTLLVAHRQSTLHLADRIVVLDDGRVVDHGTHEELLARSPVYRTLLSGLEEDLAMAAGDRIEALAALGRPVGGRRHDGLGLAGPARRPGPTAPGPSGPPAPRLPRPLGTQRRANPSCRRSERRASAPGWAAAVGTVAEGAAAGASIWPRRPNCWSGSPRCDRCVTSPMSTWPKRRAHDKGFDLRRLLREFRRPLLLGLVLVVIDALASLAGPILIKTGIDNGVAKGSEAVLFASAAHLSCHHLGRPHRRDRRDVRHRSGRRTDHAVLAHPHLVPHAASVAGLLRARDGGSDHDQNDHRRRPVRIADRERPAFRARLPRHLCRCGDRPRRHQPRARPVHALRRDSPGDCDGDLPAQGRPALRPLARAHRHRQRRLPGEHLGRAGFAGLRAPGRDHQTLPSPGPRVPASHGWRRSGWWRSTSPSSSSSRASPTPSCSGVGAGLIASGHLTSGALIAFILYIDLFFSPIQQLSQVFDSWQQTRVSVARIADLMQLETLTPPAAEPIMPGRLRGALTLDHVRFAYPSVAPRPGLEHRGPKDPRFLQAADAGSYKPPEALRGIDLRIEPGETVALVGQTGAGKSTVMKLLARFYDPDHGAVRVDDYDLRSLDLLGYRRQLGYVPQEAFLFTGTIRDNIAYGRPEAGNDEVEAAARAVGAHDFIAALPGGYLHELLERGRSLSSGQRQLIALARAELVDPVILLLDEATSNLDLATEARVAEAMQQVVSPPDHDHHRPSAADRQDGRPHRRAARR